MIMMPAWIVSENEDGYIALLGSEPKTDAEKEFLPKECVDNIVYAAMMHKSGYKFCMMVLNPEKIPEKLKNLLSR